MDIEFEIREIKRRLTSLENAGKTFGPLPVATPGEVFPFPRIWGGNSCAKCGIQLSNVMMYSCPHIDCPSGLNGASCSV